MLTIERLKQVIYYDPESGVFTRIEGGRGRRTGVIHQGAHRLKIQVDGERYKAHRLAWFYVHGEWPSGMIDHRSTNFSENGINNLRDVDAEINAQNKRQAHRNNQAGLLGVRAKKNGRFQAQIQVGKINRSIGTFSTAKEAHEAYVLEKRIMHRGCTL